MNSAVILMCVSIAVYIIGMLLVGFHYSKKNNDADDFYLGGRKLGPYVTAMSAEASDMSSWLLMGLPGVALLAGLAEASWTAIGLAIGTYVNWLIVAKRIRLYSQKIGAFTIPDFFSRRFRENKKILNAVAAIAIIVFFVPYAASGFNACGTLFASIFGVDYFWAMLISAIVIVLYTSLGGFLAASTTDFIQSIVMTMALVVVVFFGVKVAGGWDAVVENAKALPGYLKMTSTYDVVNGVETSYSGLTIASTLAWGRGYFGMPHILLRFMAIENPQKLKTSRRVATVWVVISMAVAILIGIIGYSMTKVDAFGDGVMMTASTESQRIIIKVAELLSKHGWLAAVTAGVILAGILAATMSTADSQLLAAASSVSQNLLRDVFGFKISEKTAMVFARLTVIVIAIIGVIWAREEGSVFSSGCCAWAGFGAAFGPVVLGCLFWKRMTRWGALAGMISGGAMVFIWKYGIAKLGGIFAIYELLPAFLAGCIAIIVVSLLTKAPSEEIQKEFEEVRAAK